MILSASHVGFPLSTTHVISGAIMGAGAAKRVSAVRWGVAGNIVDRVGAHAARLGAVGALTYGVVALLGADEAGPVVVVRRAAGRARRRARPAPARRPDPDGGGLMPVFAVDLHLLWQVDLGLAAGGRRRSRAVLARDRRPSRARARPAAPGQRGVRGGFARAGRRSRSCCSRVGVVLGVQAMITK